MFTFTVEDALGLIVGLPNPLMFFPFPICPICSKKKKKDFNIGIEDACRCTARTMTAKLQLIKIYKIASSIGSTLFLSIYHYVKV